MVLEAMKRCPNVDGPVRSTQASPQGRQAFRSPYGEENAHGCARYHLVPTYGQKPCMAESIW